MDGLEDVEIDAPANAGGTLDGGLDELDEDRCNVIDDDNDSVNAVCDSRNR